MSGTVDGQAVTASLVYDVLGRLAQTSINAATSVTTQLHYDGDALIGEYVGGALTQRYVHGDSIDEPLVQYSTGVVSAATRRFLHADHQGSIIAHSNSAGSAVQTNSYDSYGIPASTNDGRFGYTGQTWLRQLGLNYYKARVYSPRLGRFLQTDPIFYADDMNLYGYTGNDPLSRRDSSGTYSCEVNGAVKSCLGTKSEVVAMKKEFTGYRITSTQDVAFDLRLDPPDPTRNTVITDGSGFMDAQVGTGNETNAKPVVEAIRRHEQWHITQYVNLARNLDILKGQPRGLTIGVTWPDSEKNGTHLLERQAYEVEAKFLRRALQDSNDQNEKTVIMKRLSTIATKVKEGK
jgi:RHS repeat-associated protein